METDINYTDHDRAVVSTDEPKLHRRIREYMAEYPDQVTIKYEPETNDGNMIAHVPVSWVNLRPPRRLELTDEQRVERAERLRNSRQKYRLSWENKTNEKG